MYPNLRQIILLSIISITLLSLTGCGEKRVHVATISGAPGDELILDPMTGNVESQSMPVLNDASLDEATLLSQGTNDKEISAKPTTSDLDNAPINMARESTSLSSSDGPSEPFPADSRANALGSELSNNNNTFASLAEGQDVSTQSSSVLGEQLDASPVHNKDAHKPANSQELPAHNEDDHETANSQDFLAELQETLSGEGMEPVPDAFQIAKAAPSDSLQNQINQIKNEELAAAEAGLEDVYFQFDSWTLTQEGKQALQRTLGWFEQAPSSNLIIEGHADQRGTQAYNMVLAKKRAAAVQDYLSQFGIDASRLAIISYGKDKPFCQDATEVCHQLNRRGHLLVPNQ